MTSLVFNMEENNMEGRSPELIREEHQQKDYYFYFTMTFRTTLVLSKKRFIKKKR
jgi:hypothetical protein